MQSTIVDGPKTFTAGEDLLIHRRVLAETSTTTTPGSVIYADAGEQAIGVTLESVSDGDLVSVQLYTKDGTLFGVAAEAFLYGVTLYAGASGTIQDTATGSAIGVALEAATAANDVVEYMPFAVLSNAAVTTTITDSGLFTDAANVEAALAEIYQHIATAKGLITIPMPTITDAGVALAAFTDAASALPGFCVTAEGLGIRWNDHSTPTPVGTKIIVPPDMDAGSDAVLHILAAKVGATVGDAVKFTVEAFNNDVAALYDADDDFGGDSSAMTGDSATKTVQEVTLTLANANLTAAPAAIELTIGPKNGTLGTDDVIMLAAWIEYQRKILTA